MSEFTAMYILMTLTLSITTWGQGAVPKDYFNKDVQAGQLSTTKKFLRLIETEQTKQALDLLDVNYLTKNPEIQNQLTSIATLVHKIKDRTELSEGLIVYEENHNIYRCIYYDDKAEYQLIDLHFEEGNPASKILKLTFKDEKILKKEKDERESNTTEPPPPPSFGTTDDTRPVLSNETGLEKHKIFKIIEISVPDMAKRLENNKEIVEEMGLAKFASADKKVEITFRKMENVNLPEIKSMMDGMAESMYNANILRSEIIEVNKIKIFVTDIRGQWNGKGDIIGMFRYYFNVKGDSYSLLMTYPPNSIDSSKGLKDKMINSIVIK